MRITIIWVGKTENASIKNLAADYLGRLRHLVSCQVVELRDLSKGRALQGEGLILAEGAEIAKALPKNPRVVTLEERGREFSSLEFARWLELEQSRGTREITFVIGGAQGLSAMITARAHLKLSLGKMTWTHEMCRVLLLEQLYRAYTILGNIPYHK